MVMNRKDCYSFYAGPVRYGYDPIVILHNNDGCLTERLILESEFDETTLWCCAQ